MLDKHGILKSWAKKTLIDTDIIFDKLNFFSENSGRRALIPNPPRRVIESANSNSVSVELRAVND